MKFKLNVTRFLVSCVLLTIHALGHCASTTTVVVNGASGPWEVSVNPSYPYGIFANGAQSQNLPPTVVDSSSGLPFTPGDQLSIASMTPGQSTLYGGEGASSDAGGVPGWLASNHGPEQYIGTNILLEELIGTFANNGVIVGTPFAIGNGPTIAVIPQGANELLNGVDDDWYNDNGGSVSVSVTELPPRQVTNTATVVVNGASGPWDTTLNPGLPLWDIFWPAARVRPAAHGGG